MMRKIRARHCIAVRHVCVRRFATGLSVSPSRTNRVSIGRTRVPMQWLRSLATFAALAIALLLWAEDADARLEGTPSVGKSAAGTFLTPQVAAPALAVIAANDHATAGSSSYPGGSLGGLFSRPGVLGGFAAGFLGSGVLGLLFGHGFLGGLCHVVAGPRPGFSLARLAF